MYYVMRRNKETKYSIRNIKYDPFQQINYKVTMSCFSFTGYNNKRHLRHESLYRWGKHDWQCGRQRDHRYCLSHYLASSLLILPAVAVQRSRWFLFEICLLAQLSWTQYLEELEWISSHDIYLNLRMSLSDVSGQWSRSLWPHKTCFWP